MKPKILHVSFDYAENNTGVSTVVVGNLVKVTSNFAQTKVISLTRSSNPFKEKLVLMSENMMLQYTVFGLPAGLFLLNNMKRLYNRILDLQELGKINLTDIDIIHSHKLTFEGVIGYLLASKFNKILFVSLRQTDFYVLRYRKDLIPFTKNILAYSSRIFFIAPYMKTELLKVFGKDFYNNIINKKLIYLPNIIDLTNFYPDNFKSLSNLLTISWLKKEVVRRKNLFFLLKAFAQLKDKSLQLDIIGHGNYEKSVRNWVTKFNLEGRVNLLGFVPNEQIAIYIRRAKAFLMPSKSETFGVAYVEALACGTPILYSKDTGFDGVFENVGECVDPYSVQSIKNGIEKCIINNVLYRANINKLISQGALNSFSAENIQKIYLDATKTVLDKKI